VAANFQVRHEAEARSPVEEFTRFFEKDRGVLKDALDDAQAGTKNYRLVRRQMTELYALREDRANAAPG
jgi:hypothetical protein